MNTVLTFDRFHAVRRHQQSVQLAGDGTEAKKKLKKKASKKTSAHDPKDKIREINFLLLPGKSFVCVCICVCTWHVR